MGRWPFPFVRRGPALGPFVALLAAAACAGDRATADRLVGTGWTAVDATGVTRMIEFRAGGGISIAVDRLPDFGVPAAAGSDADPAAWRQLRDIRAWRRQGETIVLSAGDGTDLFVGTVVDGRLALVPADAGADRPAATLDPDPPCPGVRETCGNRVYCMDDEYSRSLRTVPDLNAADFDTFRSAFMCVAELSSGTPAALTSVAATPLPGNLIADDPSAGSRFHDLTGKAVERRHTDLAALFGSLDLWTSTRPAPLGPAFDRPEGGAVIFYNLLFRFGRVGGRWMLTEASTCDGDDCTNALLCGVPFERPLFPGAAATGREDFHAFYRRFYCAVAAGLDDVVRSRTRFPLRLGTNHVDGDGERSVVLDAFRPELLHVIDGGVPDISVDGGSAAASILDPGNGRAITERFELIGDRWHLTGVTISGD